MTDDVNKETQSGEGNNSGDNGSGESISPEAFKKLQEQNQRLKGQLTDVEKKYNTFSSMYKDIDPDEARILKSKLEEAERKAAEKDPQKMEELFERKIKKYQGEWESEKSTLTQTLEALKKENKTLKVTDKVMAEIAGLFNADAIKFIKREVEELCDLDEDGVIVVKDENGDPIFRNGKYVGIKDFGDMLVEKYPSLAKAQGTGGGASATPGHKVQSRMSKIPESLAELNAMPNPREVLERLKKENPEAVRKILSNTRS